MIFACFDVGEGNESIEIGTWGSERRFAWLLHAVVERSGWRVAGVYVQPEDGWPRGTEYLDLPTAPPPRGPIQ